MNICDETGIEIVSNGPISGTVMHHLKSELMVEKARAEADGEEPFTAPVWVGYGTLQRQTDGKVFFKPVEW